MNLATNFLDRDVAPKAIKLLACALDTWYADRFRGRDVVIIGPEVAGGILVGQLAASQTSVSDWANFVYMRKSVKETGTRQQLEGPYKFTSRTPESAPLAAIWLDDCISTGSSLVKAVEQLKDKYNIHIEVAAFIVDRSADRVSLKEQHLDNEFCGKVEIKCIFDLSELDVAYHQLISP